MPRSTTLARVRLPRRGRPSRAEPEPRQPAAQPEPEDLSDDIVQQLFATGIAMRTTQGRCGDNPEVAGRIAEHMNDLQRIIEQIRSSNARAMDPPTAVRTELKSA